MIVDNPNSPYHPLKQVNLPDARGHMCPRCGSVPEMICGYCHGGGLVDDATFGRWQRDENLVIAEIVKVPGQ